MLCAECTKRPAKFKVRGRIKQDKDPARLCAECFRDLQNSLNALKLPSPRTINWTEKNKVAEYLRDDGSVIIRGNDVPNPEDPSDPRFTVTIFLHTDRAFVESHWVSNGEYRATGVPSLVRNMFGHKATDTYFKHWLFKVLDDPEIYRADTIRIEGKV